MNKNIFRNLAIVFAFAFSSVWSPMGQVIAQETNDAANIQTGSSIRSTDRIIIKYVTDADANHRISPMQAPQELQMSRLENEVGIDLVYVRPLSSSENAHVLQLTERLPEDQVEAISAELMTLPEVEYAEPDSIRYPVLSPNDTNYLTEQWNLFDTWGINAPAAWDVTTGDSDVVIAILDTGILMHEDLDDRVVNGDNDGEPGYDFISPDGVDDFSRANDGNGRDGDARDPGNWIEAADQTNPVFPPANCPIMDSTWHGSLVAGIIGAESNNGIGVAGIDWNAKILPVRVLGKCGGYVADIADGMRWAAGLTVSGVPANQTPAKVINLSFAGPGACSVTEQNAINAVTTAGAVVVVASGNDNQDLDVNQSSPANCTGVITVGGTDANGHRSLYSNYGSTVEISAPADDIYSTWDTSTTYPNNDNAYLSKSGSSMAAPQVSSVLGLMFAVNPNLTPSQALKILQSTAKDFPGGSDCTTTDCGAGIVDAAAAVQAAKKPDLIVTGYQFVDINTGVPLTGTPVTNQDFSIQIMIKNQGGDTTESVVWAYAFIDANPTPLIGEYGCLDMNALTPGEDYFFEPDLNPQLAPGASAPIKVDINGGLSAGTHQLYLYADADCINNESFEDNNAYGPITNAVSNPVTTRTIIYSTGTQDGWVLESTETSETGGTADAASTVVIVGDDASDRQYRTMLSFNTAGLPDTAVITKAVLSLRVYEVLGGGNPIKVFNYFMADVRGGWFGSSSSLAAQDFANNPTSPTVTAGPLGALNRGGWYYVDIKTGKSAINKAGLTQIRLRFSIGDDDNGISNIVKIYSGNSVVRPQLSLWYYVP